MGLWILFYLVKSDMSIIIIHISLASSTMSLSGSHFSAAFSNLRYTITKQKKFPGKKISRQDSLFMLSCNVCSDLCQLGLLFHWELRHHRLGNNTSASVTIKWNIACNTLAESLVSKTWLCWGVLWNFLGLARESAVQKLHFETCKNAPPIRLQNFCDQTQKSRSLSFCEITYCSST